MEITVEHQGPVNVLTPLGEIEAKTVDRFAPKKREILAAMAHFTPGAQ